MIGVNILQLSRNLEFRPPDPVEYFFFSKFFPRKKNVVIFINF